MPMLRHPLPSPIRKPGAPQRNACAFWRFARKAKWLQNWIHQAMCARWRKHCMASTTTSNKSASTASPTSSPSPKVSRPAPFAASPDKVTRSKSCKARDIGGKAVRLEVRDIERLHRHSSEGKPRDELVVD